MAYIENIQTFVKVYEIQGMSAAGRELRISPAVTSARISQLEEKLGVRLFHRNTRTLSATEQGHEFYQSACNILEAIAEAEASISVITDSPRGELFVSAPLGIGRRIIAPLVPKFHEAYPEVRVRLRLTDRSVNITSEGLDFAVILGRPKDSELRIRVIHECKRVLCASSSYIDNKGSPRTAQELITKKHACLNLRFPGAQEFQWSLNTDEGIKKFAVRGPFECDDSDVLTKWALNGHGIVMKPLFEVQNHLQSGALHVVAPDNEPVPIQLAMLYTHKKLQDPKVRLFMDFVGSALEDQLQALETGAES